MSEARVSREEQKRSRELEELRKAGIAQPAFDEEGNIINPHIPNYISKRPWYLGGSEAQGLKHQYRLEQPDTSSPHDWYSKPEVSVPDTRPAKKFRKGACENCGGMNHSKKECLERPRARNAKHGGRSVGLDESAPQTEKKLGFDAKRDRWGGFEANQYESVLKRHEKAEQLRLQSLENQPVEDSDGVRGSDGAVFQKRDDGTRTTVRTLRIREDKAKYLRNLSLDSAHYDPKTRSMRENPHADKDPKDLEYAGDNFVRYSGDSKEVTELQLFAWEQWEKSDGGVVDAFSNPSLTEKLFKEQKQEKALKVEVKKNSVLEKYGGKEHLLIATSADEVELIQKKKEQLLISGVRQDFDERAEIPKSKYDEDVFPHNHRSIWGSYFHDGKWGYACCHQMLKGSYCTGIRNI